MLSPSGRIAHGNSASQSMWCAEWSFADVSRNLQAVKYMQVMPLMLKTFGFTTSRGADGQTFAIGKSGPVRYENPLFIWIFMDTYTQPLIKRGRA